MSDKKQRELKFSMEDQLEDIKIATVDCMVCLQPIDVSLQPHGWMHLECEKTPNPEAVWEEEFETEAP